MPKTELQDPCHTSFILVGEDDRDDQVLLQEVFETIDNRIPLVFVDTGQQILSTLENLHADIKPCLLILDYNMPGLNGWEILKAVNGNQKYIDIPKILWSTSGLEKYRTPCLELGALEYIIKPSSTLELERIVRFMISVCKKAS